MSAVMSKLSTNADPDQIKSPTIGVDPLAVVNLTVEPADIVTKMVEGSVQKYLKEVSLFDQTFVKNDKQTVEQMLKAANTKVASFTLYVVGEGIEKRQDDFAAEVAAQVAAAKATA